MVISLAARQEIREETENREPGAWLVDRGYT
jgi:hypothetical protein